MLFVPNLPLLPSCSLLNSQSSYPAEVRSEHFLRSFSAEGVVKFWSHFLCATFSKVWVSNSEISPTFHTKNGVKNGIFHADFTLLGRGADEGPDAIRANLPALTTLFSPE